MVKNCDKGFDKRKTEYGTAEILTSDVSQRYFSAVL